MVALEDSTLCIISAVALEAAYERDPARTFLIFIKFNVIVGNSQTVTYQHLIAKNDQIKIHFTTLKIIVQPTSSSLRKIVYN
jgi:hypothetical protein